MSLYYNDYIIASNNSINDNKYNAALFAKSESSASGKLRKLLKAVIKKMLKPRYKINKSNKEQNQLAKSFDDNSENLNFWGSECHNDNSANEELESRIISEIQECADDSAVYVYDEEESCEIQPVYRDELIVPVNFVRTEAGTFFWTTMHQSVEHQMTEREVLDRWAQA